MKLLLALLAGFAWGALCALPGLLITKKALAKTTTAALIAGNFLRMGVDLAALAAIFLLRDRLPFDYTWCLIGAALALTAGLLLVSFRLARKK